MSIRLLARDLYRLIREVEQLENQLQRSSAEKNDHLRTRLHKVRAERDRLRRALEGRKDRS